MVGQSAFTTEEEPRDLDTDNQAVLDLYDDIKRILERYTRPESKSKQDQPSVLKDEKQVLPCSRILKVNVERKLVTITLMKSDGEIIQLRVQAAED